MRQKFAIVLTGLLSAIWGGASASQSVDIRAEPHPGFLRLSFPARHYRGSEVRNGTSLVLSFSDHTSIRVPPRQKRSVEAFHRKQNLVTVDLSPGTHGEPSRIGNQIIIDIYDRPLETASATKERKNKIERPEPVSASTILSPAVSTRDLDVRLPQTEAQTGSEYQPLQPSPINAELASSPSDEPAIPLSFFAAAEGNVGMAVFRRGDRAIFVFDRAIDFASNPVEAELDRAHADYQASQDAATLTLNWPEEAPIRLARNSVGWEITSEPNEPATERPVAVKEADSSIVPIDFPGRVVSIVDPETGHNLLIGTIRSTDRSTRLAADERRTPDYSLLRSEYGVVLEPNSDTVEMKPLSSGFKISGVAQPSKAFPEPFTARPITYKFDLSAPSISAQTQRLSAELASASAKPIRSRGPERLALAQTELSLGLGSEALAILGLTAEDDPVAAKSVELKALAAIAALVAGRPANPSDLDSHELDGSDEIDFWRGVQKARATRSVDDAAALYRSIPLLLTYAEPLRRHFLPWIIEAALKTSSKTAFKDLPKNEQEFPALAFAKGLQFEVNGDAAAALGVYEGILRGADLRDQVHAAAQAAELKVRMGSSTPQQAAQVIESQAFIWRGDDLEIQLRLWAVKLELQAGLWRQALVGLKYVDSQVPDDDSDQGKQAIKRQIANVFRIIPGDHVHSMSAMETVSFAKDFHSDIPSDISGHAFNRLVAESLLKLDLPEQAIPKLRTLLEQSTPGVERGELGAMLAQALTDAGRASEVTTVLTESAGDGYSATLEDQRAMIYARVQAALGNIEQADAALAARHTTPADEARASLLADSGNWKRALSAVAEIAQRDLPALGPLSEAQQEIVIRYLSTAVRAEDTAAIKEIYDSRFPQMTAPRDQVLRLLAGPAISSVSSLGRARQELASAKAFDAYAKLPAR